MSSWQNIKAEDLDLDGDEINIHYDDDSSGALYLVVKVKDIKKLLAVRDERSEESVCYCAEINSRNCPKHQNSEESADTIKTPQWEKEFEDMFPFELETNIAIREDIKGGYHERIDVRDDVKAFIKSTLEDVIEKIHECCDGECYHDDCCGKLSCVKAQLRKEFLNE